MTQLLELATAPEYQLVCGADDLWEGEMAEFDISGVRDLLVHLPGGHISALQPLCPHQRVPLVEGELCGQVLTCRAHHWQLDARTGRGLNPHHAHVAVYPVKIEDGQVFVSVSGVAPRYSSP